MRRLITERDVIHAFRNGNSTLELDKTTLVTPLARDAARQYGVSLVQQTANSAPQGEAPDRRPTLAGVRTLALGADHGGFALKNVLVGFLKAQEFQVEDLGTFSPDPVDYPDIAHRVARAVAQGTAQFGIIIDGAGIGSAMVANKLPGIRAACCNDLFTAANSREHNAANILTLGGRVIGDELAKKIVLTWLQTDFGGGRHKKRVDKISGIDQEYRMK